MALWSTWDNVRGTYNQDLTNGLENVPVVIDCSGVDKADLPNFQVIFPWLYFKFNLSGQFAVQLGGKVLKYLSPLDGSTFL